MSNRRVWTFFEVFSFDELDIDCSFDNKRIMVFGVIDGPVNERLCLGLGLALVSGYGII